MKGFVIEAKTENGEEILLRDINQNKKVFSTITLRSKPFLELEFRFKERSPFAFLLNKMGGAIKDSDLKRHICEKLNSLGAKEGKDYTFKVIA